MDRLREDAEPLLWALGIITEFLSALYDSLREWLGPWSWALWAVLIVAAWCWGVYRAAQKSKKFRTTMSGGMDGSGATLWRSASGMTRDPRWLSPFYGRPGWLRSLPYPVGVLLLAWWIEAPGSLVLWLRVLGVVLVVLWLCRHQVRKVRKRFTRPIFFSVARFLELDPRVERPHKWVRVPVGLFSGQLAPDESDVATIRESVLLVWARDLGKRMFAWSEDYRQALGARWSGLRDRFWEVWGAIYPNADRIVMKLPESFAGVENGKNLVSEVVKTRIPGSWDAHWLLTEGPKSRVYFTRSKKPPKKVTLADLYALEEVQKVTDYFRPPIGMDHDHKVVFLDMQNKQPHFLISAPTGWGKTTTGLLIVNWLYMHGAIVDVVDPKQTEYMFLEGLPGVSVHNDDYAMPRAVTAYLEDLKFRQEWAKNKGIQPHELPIDLFPPRLLLVDEMGSFVRIVKDQWRMDGEKGEPITFSHVMQILWRGRAFRMHMGTQAQQANARVLIDSDARDNYGYKIAAGPQSLSSWRMMFGNVPKPRIASRKGAAILGDGPDDLTDLQLAYVSQREVVELMKSRDPLLPTVGYDQTRGVPPETDREGAGKTLSIVPGHRTPVLTSVKGEEPGEEWTPERPLRVLPGGLVEMLEGESEGAEKLPPIGRESAPEPEEEPEPLIVGNKKGLEFINSIADKPRTESWFLKTRQRHPIDGEITVGGTSPAWTENTLRAWYSARVSKVTRSRAAKESRKTG